MPSSLSEIEHCSVIYKQFSSGAEGRWIDRDLRRALELWISILDSRLGKESNDPQKPDSAAGEAQQRESGSGNPTNWELAS